MADDIQAEAVRLADDVEYALGVGGGVRAVTQMIEAALRRQRDAGMCTVLSDREAYERGLLDGAREEREASAKRERESYEAYEREMLRVLKRLDDAGIPRFGPLAGEKP